MAVLDIYTYPDERLKQPSEPVQQFDEILRQRVVDLEDTRRAAPGCIGIAAPQVGWFERVVIVDLSSKPAVSNHGYMVLINPEILTWEGMEIGREGCLSVPDYTGNVIRAERITLDAFDVDGNKQHYAFEGFESRAVQHELDHLDGLLFVDRLVSRRNDLFRRKVYKK